MTWLFFSVLNIIAAVVYAAWRADSLFYELERSYNYNKRVETVVLNWEAIFGYVAVSAILALLGPLPIMAAAIAAPLVGLFLFVRKITRKK